MPFSVNGIGTTYYGSRDFQENGSYITTEWFIFLFIPIFPLGSFRVLPVDRQWYNVFSGKYWVWKVPLCGKQVRNTYLALLFVVLAIMPFWLFGTNETFISIYTIVLLCAVIAWLVKSYRRRTKVRRSHSASRTDAVRATTTQVIPEDEDLGNPLDRHLEIQVTESQLQRQETIHINVPFKETTVSFQLQPEMRGKKVRLRGVLEKGAGHLFVQIRVSNGSVSEANVSPFPSRNPENEELNQLMKRLQTITLGDEQTIERLIKAEQRKHPTLLQSELIQLIIERWELDNRA